MPQMGMMDPAQMQAMMMGMMNGMPGMNGMNGAQNGMNGMGQQNGGKGMQGQQSAPPPQQQQAPPQQNGGGHGAVAYSASPEAEAYRKENNLNVTASPGSPFNVPDPFMTWDLCKGKIPDRMLEVMAVFEKPTCIQAQVWPIALGGVDCVGIAKTGSGKTLGFLIPAFILMETGKLSGNKQQGASVLVMAPTRELATQIQVEAEKFGNPLGIHSVCMYGGAPKGEQMGIYRRGVQVIVATPGRLNDFLEAGQVHLRNCGYLVMDEADRMLDMGFEPQIRKVLAQVPPGRITQLFSATWPKEVRRLADEFQRNPIRIEMGNVNELTANKDITQTIEIVSNPRDKTNTMMRACQQLPQGELCIVFTNTKKMADRIQMDLQRSRIPAVAIHGDKDQRTRDMALADFKEKKVQVMVATDVAARGLDIKNVKMVINYDPPNNAEDYVHRIGRTGRAGMKGTALTILCTSDNEDARRSKGIIQIMEKAQQQVPEALLRFRESYQPGMKGKGKGMRDSFGREGGGYDREERGVRPSMGGRDSFGGGGGRDSFGGGRDSFGGDRGRGNDR